MITENILRVKLEATGEGQLKASLSDTTQSVTDLDAAQQAAAASADTAAQAAGGEAAATAALGESVAETDARIKAMVRSSMDRQQAELSAISATQRATQATASASVGYDRLVQSQTLAMHGATDMVRAEQQAAAAAANTAGLEQQRTELGKLLGQIDPTVAALARLDAQQAKLNQFRASGVLGTDDYKMFSAVIDQSRERIAAAGDAMHGFSLNNAQARREFGYLVKDMATGQYGRLSQSALTLASNTGLMGLAFSGAGVAVAAAGAALVAFGYGAVEAYQNEQKLNAAIAQTGNFAGVTTGQVEGLAAGLGAATGQAGEARDILLALAANGRVGQESFAALGQAAFDMAELTGQSADKAAASVTQMFDGTAAGALKANEQYHFLTDAVYDRIKALEEEGKSQEAVQVAAEAFHDAVGPRIDEMKSQVYGLASAWDSVATATRNWWQTFKTGAALIAGTADITNQYYAQLGLAQTEIEDFGHVSRGHQEKLDSLKRQMDAANARAEAAATQTRRSDDAVTASAQLDRLSASLDKADGKTRALKELTAAFDKLWASAGPKNKRLDGVMRIVGEDGGVSFAGGEFDKLKGGIDKKYAVRQRKGPRSREPGAFATFSGQVDALDRKTIQGASDALTEYQQGIDKLSHDMDVYMQHGGDATKAAAEFDRGQQALQRTLDSNHKRELAAQHEYAAALAQSNDALQQSIDNQVAHIGMGDQEYQRTQQITKAYRDQAEQLQKLALQRQAGVDGQKGGLSQSAYEADVQALQAATDRKVGILQDGYQRMDEAQGDWVNGARAAWEDYAAQAKDVAGQAQRGITTLYGDAEDAAADWLAGGKLTFKSFQKDFENMLAHMVAKALIAQATTALLNLFASPPGPQGSGFGYFGGGETLGGGGGFNFAAASGGHADGGPIHGPGTGTSDSVLIRASNGEYMQTADAVNYYGERFMDDIRAKRLPRYAQGGPIGGGGGGGAGGGAPTIIINNNGDNEVQASSEQQADGSWLTKLVINAVAGDMAAGGKTAKAAQARFGLVRRGVPVGG